MLRLSVEDNRIVLRKDLWSELIERGKRLKVDIDEAESELDEAEELLGEEARRVSGRHLCYYR